ncbi:MAG TPA: DUF167 domain-containing protein [Rhizomicrobium sp.]|nr:DUF167 domain-containing protein [Rhizomicrobium sp.]
MKPYAATQGGVQLALRLTPRASRNGVDGIVADAEGRPLLKLRLVAPPVEGAANDALIAFLAKTLSLRKADITIRSGETSRVKILHLAGDSAAILRKLDARLAQNSGTG